MGTAQTIKIRIHVPRHTTIGTENGFGPTCTYYAFGWDGASCQSHPTAHPRDLQGTDTFFISSSLKKLQTSALLAK